MQITGHSVEKVEDPFGILSGERYELFLNIIVPEDDELYSEKGLKLRVLYIDNEKGSRISNYYFIENTTEGILDFELDEEELSLVEAYIKEQLDIKE